eukprot:2529542-Rhodomonas_salina.3
MHSEEPGLDAITAEGQGSEDLQFVPIRRIAGNRALPLAPSLCVTDVEDPTQFKATVSQQSVSSLLIYGKCQTRWTTKVPASGRCLSTRLSVCWALVSVGGAGGVDGGGRVPHHHERHPGHGRALRGFSCPIRDHSRNPF